MTSRKSPVRGALFGASLLASTLLAAPAFAQDAKPLKIGVLTDLNSVYSDIGGKGNIEAAKMAIEDFGGQMFGKPIERVIADATKPVVAATLARKWWEAITGTRTTARASSARSSSRA